MPPAIQEDDLDRPLRLPLKPTRGGLISAGTNHVRQYSSPYIIPRSPPLGKSHLSSQPVGHSSRTDGQSSKSYGIYSGARAAFDVTLNPASRPQAQVEFPVYQSLGSATQRNTNPLVPPQMNRLPQFQEHGPAQRVLGSSSSQRISSEGYSSRPLPQGYQSPYESSVYRPYYRSGHNHDIAAPDVEEQPQPESQYQYQQTESHDLYPERASPYTSPYYSDPSEHIAPAHSRPQEYSQAPMAASSSHNSHIQQQAISQPLYNTESSVYPSSSPSPAPPSSPARRGRPPGKKMVKPSKLAIEIHPSPIKKRRGRPSRNPLGISPSNSISAPSRSDSRIKKRGRPYKSAESAAIAKAKATGEYAPKKRGRPMKAFDYKEVAVPLAEYVPFICQWKGCTAQLHNLETLKKHLWVIHEKKDGAEGMVCAWGRCAGQIHETEDVSESPDTSISERNVFASRKERNEHINKAHLIPFSWHVGDGPNSTCLDQKPNGSDPWLLDGTGNQVTPAINDQITETGIAKVKNKARWIKEMGKLNIAMKSQSTGSYMKTQAQIVNEEGADTETGSGGGEVDTGNEEAGAGADVNTGDDDADEGTDRGNDTEMEEVEHGEGHSSIEGSGNGEELMVLDRL